MTNSEKLKELMLRAGAAKFGKEGKQRTEFEDRYKNIRGYEFAIPTTSGDTR